MWSPQLDEAQFTPLSTLLAQRAHTHPQLIAHRFLDAESALARPTETLTYATLYNTVRSIAALLRDRVPSGAPVALCYPPGLDYIPAVLACLATGTLAIPLPSFRPDQPLPLQVGAILAATQPALILTSAALAAAHPDLGVPQSMPTPERVATDRLPPAEAPLSWPHPTPQTVALLAFGSDIANYSRAFPITYEQLYAQVLQVARSSQQTSTSHLVNWLPHEQCTVLVTAILYPLLVGFPATWLDPSIIYHQPLRWLQAISHYQGTFSAAPDFGYLRCIQAIATTPLPYARLDLRSWVVALVGNGQVHAETLAHFAETFATVGFASTAFTPCYSPLGTPALLSTTPAAASPRRHSWNGNGLAQQPERPIGSTPPLRELVSHGIVDTDLEFAIIDPHTGLRCPPATVGEIWVRGATIATSYWQQPAAVQQTIRGYLADTGEGPFLRTGDLGFLAGGDLFVTGRLPTSQPSLSCPTIQSAPALPTMRPETPLIQNLTELPITQDLKPEGFVARPRPTRSYVEALERLTALRIQDAAAAVDPRCRGQLLTHGTRTEQAVVLLHGYTDCPQQCALLGALFWEQGYNVLIPRMPYQGLADKKTHEHAKLTAEDLIIFAETAIDIACGLGERVTVAGVSASAVVLSWLAYQRTDIDRQILFSPSISFGTTKGESVPSIKTYAVHYNAKPNRILPWGTPRPPLGYTQYATHVIIEIQRLALATCLLAYRQPSMVSETLLVTSAYDTAINHTLIAELVALWQHYPDSYVQAYTFDAALEVGHSLIHPDHPLQKVDLVYPVLQELLFQQHTRIE